MRVRELPADLSVTLSDAARVPRRYPFRIVEAVARPYVSHVAPKLPHGGARGQRTGVVSEEQPDRYRLCAVTVDH